MQDRPSNEELEAIRLMANSQPMEDFCGLTPSEMHDLIYKPFSPDSPLKINSPVPDAVLDRIPFFRLTEEFLKLIQRNGSVKLTPLGALQKKTLSELYDHRFILDEGVEQGIHTLTREMDSLAITALHYNTVFAGLIRKAKGKLTLTKEGIMLVAAENRNQLFMKTFQAFTEKLAWSNFDGYPAMPIGNLGWGFTILLLLKFGSEPRAMGFYAEKYIRAFPTFLDTFPKRDFSTPEKDLTRCYCLRTFERFLEWWGFVSTEKLRPGVDREKFSVTSSATQHNIFNLR